MNTGEKEPELNFSISLPVLYFMVNYIYTWVLLRNSRTQYYQSQPWQRSHDDLIQSNARPILCFNIVRARESFIYRWIQSLDHSHGICEFVHSPMRPPGERSVLADTRGHAYLEYHWSSEWSPYISDCA